jgi:hypothetical protein
LVLGIEQRTSGGAVSVAKNFTAESTRLYELVMAEIEKVELPKREAIKLQVDEFLRAIIAGRPETLDSWAKWMISLPEDGLHDENVPEDIAEVLGVDTYGDLI